MNEIVVIAGMGSGPIVVRWQPLALATRAQILFEEATLGASAAIVLVYVTLARFDVLALDDGEETAGRASSDIPTT